MTGGKTTKWSVIKANKGRPTYTVLAERDGRFWFLRVMGRKGMSRSQCGLTRPRRWCAT
jgi:hypothetical protein